MKKNLKWLIPLVSVLVVGLVVGGVLLVKHLTDSKTPEPQTTEEIAMLFVLDEYGLSSGDELSVSAVRTYEDETAVYYTQSYKGVEIYDSSMICVVGDENYCTGTYYDLTSAFGNEFDSLVAEASKIPEWMKNEDNRIQIQERSVRPVIYITENDEARICRCFTADVQVDGYQTVVEFVTGVNDKTVYSANEVNPNYYFSDAQITANNQTFNVSQDDGVYYAYNSEYNFYVFNKVFEDAEKLEPSDYMKQSGRYWRVTKDKNLMYSTSNADWSRGTDYDMYCVMRSYYDVLQWYDSSFGYTGLDGSNGTSMLFLCGKIDGTAANSNGVAVVLSAAVANSPEVLAHEVGHSVFQYGLSRSGASRNQTGALNEALSDVFACLYMNDGKWKIGMNVEGGGRNIAGTKRSMDDYVYDRAYESDQYDDDNPLDSLVIIADFICGPIYADTSNEHKYTNSFIISHTMYEIWDRVFERDSEAFGRIFYRSFRYMPQSPDFSDFRDAFLHAMSRQYNTDTVAWTSTFFDVAKVSTNKMVNIKKSTAPVERDMTPLSDMTDSTLELLSKMKWDRFWSIGTVEETTYYYEAVLGDMVYVFGAYSEEDPMQETPFFLEIHTSAENVEQYPITKDISTGMTGTQLEDVIGTLMIQSENSEWCDCYTMIDVDGLEIRLLFRNRGEDIVVIGAQISLV